MLYAIVAVITSFHGAKKADMVSVPGKTEVAANRGFAEHGRGVKPNEGYAIRGEKGTVGRVGDGLRGFLAGLAAAAAAAAASGRESGRVVDVRHGWCDCPMDPTAEYEPDDGYELEPEAFGGIRFLEPGMAKNTVKWQCRCAQLKHPRPFFTTA